MKTKKININKLCKCADSGCPIHNGVSSCKNRRSVLLFRVDMEDRSGTWMCKDCADDAFKFGLFREATVSEKIKFN